MKRNHFPMALSVLSSLAVCPAALAFPAADGPDDTPKQRPNVILLIADDLGYGDLECYGAKNVETPNVNLLARQGIQFTNCHATAATSTPSRYSLLTGEYAWRRNDTDVAEGNHCAIIKPEQYTMADMFKSAGYATAAIGKWHLGLGPVTGAQDWNGKLTSTPRDIGFDYHYIQAATADRVPCVYLEQDTVANYDPTAPIQVSYTSNFAGEPTGANNKELLKLMWSHGHNQSIVDSISRIGYMKGGGKALWKDENIADSIVAHSRRFIMEHKDEPFFIYLCTNDVHVPRWPHARFRGKNPMGLRGDAIAQFDWTVGEVMQALEEAGIADNTLLILSSDNGPVLDDGYQDRAAELLNGHSPSGPYRSYKYSGYEGGTMVPFIVRWPERVQPAAEPNHTLLSHIDLFASLSELVGGEIPFGSAKDSGDQLAQILGESTEHRPWVSELNHTRTLSVRTARWKYLPATNGAQKVGWGPDIENGNRPYDQLYDMENDPGETTNLAEQQPEVLAMMKRIHEEALSTPGSPLIMPLMSDDTETHWYNIFTPLRNSLTMSATAGGSGVSGVTPEEGVFARAQWKFVMRPDSTVNIINRDNEKYIDPTQAAHTEDITLSATAPSVGWKISHAVTPDCMVFFTEDKSAQLNQAQAGRNYAIINWGEGRHDDDGCQFSCTEVTSGAIGEHTLPTTAATPAASTAEAPRWYTMCTPARESRYISASEVSGLTGIASTNYMPATTWRFEQRADGRYDIINQASGKYIAPQVVEGTKQLALSAEQPAEGWEFKKVSGATQYAIVSSNVQINQTDSSNGYKIFNWGGGTNLTDNGCKYRFTDVTSLVNEIVSAVPAVSASTSAAVRYYDMLGRPVANPTHGIFVRSDGRKVIF